MRKPSGTMDHMIRTTDGHRACLITYPERAIRDHLLRRWLGFRKEILGRQGRQGHGVYRVQDHVPPEDQEDTYHQADQQHLGVLLQGAGDGSGGSKHIE